MSVTKTGGFTIGFRRMGWKWNEDLDGLLKWSKETGFDAIDIGRNADKVGRSVLAAGIKLGSIDLAVWQEMLSPDAAKRKDAVARNAAYVKACADLGSMNHFVVMLPEKPDLSRLENFKYMVESFAQLAPVMEKAGARLVIEGWPGAGALCCTPESYRAFFTECPAKCFGVNYDPSHLIRMGIDPIRFLHEFADRVYHVHAKDAEINGENLYHYGNILPPTLKDGGGWGSMHWRYTLPGFGSMRWVDGMAVLKDRGYSGVVSIEHEDGRFWSDEESNKAGLKTALEFLKGC